jgi:hypothetical protein
VVNDESRFDESELRLIGYHLISPLSSRVKRLQHASDIRGVTNLT